MELYDAYCLWCEENALRSEMYDSFSENLNGHQEEYGILASKHVQRTKRGFKGVCIKHVDSETEGM